MKLIAATCTALLLGSMASLSFAEGFSPPLEIRGIDVGDTGSLVIRFTANTECGDSLASIPNTQPFYKDMMALANLAYTTKQPIRVWVSTCNSQRVANVVRMVIGTVW